MTDAKERGNGNENLAPAGRACDECGAAMEEIDAWPSKSPPLIGTTIE